MLIKATISPIGNTSDNVMITTKNGFLYISLNCSMSFVFAASSAAPAFFHDAETAAVGFWLLAVGEEETGRSFTLCFGVEL